jgi:hypothetical protein
MGQKRPAISSEHAVGPRTGDLIAFDVPDETGDVEDRLKDEVVEWLDEHCEGRWSFRQEISRDKFDDDGEPYSELSYYIDFTHRDDAFEFKMRWY